MPELAGEWQPAPPEYWALWREECELADRIVVNSEWSREGLIRGGVPAEKISIIPLAYEAPEVKEIRSQKSEVSDYSGIVSRAFHAGAAAARAFSWPD